MNDRLFTDDELNATGLPPAGYARDEELRRRTDTLTEQAETQTADRTAIPPDSDTLRPERNREIQHAIRSNYLAIGVDHPYYKTKWVNYKNLEGQKVWEAKAIGWMVATANEFPEAASLVKEDGSIRVGDVMLMFIRMDEHLKIEQREAEKRTKQQLGVEAMIHDLASRTNAKEGKVVFKNIQTPEITGVDDKLTNIMESRAARTAAQHIGNRMKQGPLPGVPIK